MSRFLHFGHMLHTPIVKAGDYVTRGQLLGSVGSTGNSTGPHCHFEVRLSRPPAWWFYPVGLSRQQVEWQYGDPMKWLKDGYPVDTTRFGFRYLQPEALGLNSIVFHPGIDLDAPIGTPIYSPCNGRVVFVEGIKWIHRWLGKLFPSTFNHGWGCHVWMEVDEANRGIDV